jgi:hypothetical protein
VWYWHSIRERNDVRHNYASLGRFTRGGPIIVVDETWLVQGLRVQNLLIPVRETSSVLKWDDCRPMYIS